MSCGKYCKWYYFWVNEVTDIKDIDKYYHSPISGPDKIRNLKVVNKTSYDISLTWQQPCFPNGIIQTYTVEVGNGNRTVQRYNTTNNRTETEVGNLDPYVQYFISIHGINIDETGGQYINVKTNATTNEAGRSKPYLKLVLIFPQFPLYSNYIRPYSYH